jgi:cathepsin B
MSVMALAIPATFARSGGQERAMLISQINIDPRNLWKATSYGRYEGQPLGAAKAMCGVDMDAYLLELRGKVLSGEVEQGKETLHAEDLPDSFDAATNPAWAVCSAIISDIRDQSACGCCWAFGAAEAASDRMCIATGGKVAVPLSAQDMCFCGSKNGCKGGFPTTAWARIEEDGLVTGGQNHGLGPFGNSSGFCSAFTLPHCHHYGPVGHDPYPAEGSTGCPRVSASPVCPTECDAQARAPHADFAQDKYSFKGKLEHYPTVSSLMSAIMTGGPVETAFKVYEDFENYAGGIYHKTTSRSLGGQ